MTNEYADIIDLIDSEDEKQSLMKDIKELKQMQRNLLTVIYELQQKMLNMEQLLTMRYYPNYYDGIPISGESVPMASRNGRFIMSGMPIDDE